MNIPPISSLPSYTPLFMDSVTPPQTEESTNPANIPLEKDIIQINGIWGKYKLFKDLNPDTSELEEGVFLKSLFPNIPALKLEGTEDLIYDSRKGNDRREIFDGKAHHQKNDYFGFFPKECSIEDSYRCKRLHTCIGIFDAEGKLIRGIWQTNIDRFEFFLMGDFTYETTETEQIIRCHGSFTTGSPRNYEADPIVVRGTFEAKRLLQESFFYCSRIDEITVPQEPETRIDSEGTIRTGIFQGEKLLIGKKETSKDIFEGEFDENEMLIYGTKSDKDSKRRPLKGLWHYEDCPKPVETIAYCYGEKLNSSEKGRFYNGFLQMGKTSIYNPSCIAEGRFIQLTPDYVHETMVTFFEPKREPQPMWIVGRGLYDSSKRAIEAVKNIKRHQYNFNF